jgi:hypothetical protein
MTGVAWRMKQVRTALLKCGYATNTGRNYACAMSLFCRGRISFVIQLGATYQLNSFELTSPFGAQMVM